MAIDFKALRDKAKSIEKQDADYRLRRTAPARAKAITAEHDAAEDTRPAQRAQTARSITAERDAAEIARPSATARAITAAHDRAEIARPARVPAGWQAPAPELDAIPRTIEQAARRAATARAITQAHDKAEIARPDLKRRYAALKEEQIAFSSGVGAGAVLPDGNAQLEAAARRAGQMRGMNREYDELTGATVGGRLTDAVGSIGSTIKGMFPALYENWKQFGRDRTADYENPALRPLQARLDALELELQNYYASGAGMYKISPEMLEKQREHDALLTQIEGMRTRTQVDPTLYGQRTMHKAAEQAAAATDMIDAERQYLAETGLSIANNAAVLPTAAIHPAVPLALIGTQAAAQRTTELNEQGATAGEALARGLVSGGIEVLTEKVSLDNLLDLIQKGGKPFLRELAQQAGVEASEEGVSYALNYLADKAAGDPNAQFSLEELMLQMGAGGLSGLALGAAGGAVRGFRGAEAARGRAGGRPQGSPLRDVLVDLSGVGANGAKNLSVLEDAVSTPEMAMGWKNYYEAGRAGIAMERVGEIPGAPQVAPQVAFAAYSAGENDRAAQVQSGLQAAEERGTIKAGYEEGALQDGGREEGRGAATVGLSDAGTVERHGADDAGTQEAAGQDDTGDAGVSGRTEIVRKEAGRLTYEYHRAAPEQTDSALSALKNEFVRRGLEADIYDAEQGVTANGRYGSPRAVASTLADGSVLISNRTTDPENIGQIPRHETIHAAKIRVPALYQRMEQRIMDSGMNLQGGREILGRIADGYLETHPDIESNFDKLFEEAFAQLTGWHAVDPEYARELFSPLFPHYDEVISALDELDRNMRPIYGAALTEAQQTAAYEAGVQDRAASLTADKARVAGAQVFGPEEAGVVQDEYAARVSEGERTFVDYLARSLGVKAQFVPTLENGRANGSIRGGVMQLALDADDPVSVIAMHEITHRIQQLAPEEYGAFREHAVQQTLAGELAGESAESLVERYIESRGGVLTVEEAMDEISADYARELLTSRAAADKLIAENRTLAQRFFDALKAMLKDLSAFVEGLTGEAREFAESRTGDLKQGYELWREAFKAAEQEIRARQSAGETALKRGADRDTMAVQSNEEVWYSGRRKMGDDDRRSGKQTQDTRKQDPRRDRGGRGDERPRAEGGIVSGDSRRVSVQDSEGRRVDPTILEKLRNTKIVDRQGRPLALYHFTEDATFQKFERGDIGFHCGTLEQARKRGKDKGAKTGRMFRMYLNLENPIYINMDIMSWKARNTALKLWSMRYLTETERAQIFDLDGNGYDSPGAIALRELLRDKGYDGIIYENGVEGSGRSFIAFYDEQIIPTDITDTKLSRKTDPMSELVQLRAENERLREQFRRTKNPAADRAGGGSARGYRGPKAARGRAGGRPQGSPLRSAEIGAHGIKNLAMLGDAVRTPAAAMGWKNYYEAGRAGIAMERVGEIRGAPQVAPQVAFAAYSAGENDRAAQAAPEATAVRQPKQDEAQTMGIQEVGPDVAAMDQLVTPPTAEADLDAEPQADVRAVPAAYDIRLGGHGTQTMEAQQTAAYEAGVQDRAASLAEGKARVAGAQVFGPEEAGVVQDEYAARVSEGERTFVDYLARSLGVKVQFVSTLENGRANGSIRGGVMQLALDADDPVSVIAMHEITHRIQQLAPEEYGAFRDYAVQQTLAGELAGERAESLVERYIESRGGALTVEEAMDEISADYARELLTSRAAADKLISENRTLAQRFFDALKAMLKDLSAFVEGLTGEAREFAESRTGDLKQGYELWREAFKAAESTAHNAQKNSVSPQDGIRYSRSVDKYYERQIDKWDGQDHGGGFRVGTPSQALLDIGIPDIDIWFDQSKATKALREHSEVSKTILKAIPSVLQNPIAISESYDKTVMVFGELFADQAKEKPIVIALRIHSTNRRNKITFVNKIRSVGTRTHNLDALLAEDKLLYLGKNKNKTRSWFNALGRSTPFGGTRFGLIRTLSQIDKNVKYSEKNDPTRELMRLRTENERLREQFRRTKNPAADRAGGRKGRPYGVRKSARMG